MKTTKKVATLAATLITFGSLAGGANAALVLNISDAGGGQSRFELSGTTTVAAYNGANNNGVWFHPAHWDSLIGLGVDGSQTIVSGSATVTTTQSGTRAVSDVWIDNSGSSAGRLGIRLSGEEFDVDNVGDTVSWSGDFVIDTDFSIFSTGSFNSAVTSVNTATDTWTASENIVIQASSIPEPSSAILLGVGVLGFATRRRRIA